MLSSTCIGSEIFNVYFKHIFKTDLNKSCHNLSVSTHGSQHESCVASVCPCMNRGSTRSQQHDGIMMAIVRCIHQSSPAPHVVQIKTCGASEKRKQALNNSRSSFWLLIMDAQQSFLMGVTKSDYPLAHASSCLLQRFLWASHIATSKIFARMFYLGSGSLKPTTFGFPWNIIGYRGQHANHSATELVQYNFSWRTILPLDHMRWCRRNKEICYIMLSTIA